MSTITFFSVGILLFLFSNKPENPERQGEIYVDCNNRLVNIKMLRQYDNIMEEIERCQDAKQLENIACMLEGFKERHGMNEWYNELFCKYLTSTMIIN